MNFFQVILSFFIFVESPYDILVPSWFDPAHHSEKVNIIEYDGITVYAENLEINSEHIVFDIEIVNNTIFPVVIEPQGAKLFTSEDHFPEDVESEISREFESGLKEINPLSEREVADDMIESMKKKQKTGTILGIITAGMVIFDAAMDIKDFNSPEWTPKKQLGSDIRNLLTMAGITATDIVRQKNAGKSLEGREDLHYLQKEIFRFGEIGDGEYERGKIFFPKKDPEYVRLILVIDNIEFVLDFRKASSEDLRALYE